MDLCLEIAISHPSSAILHGLGAVENGTRSNGTTGPCLAHGSILGYIFGKFMLQDEKIQLLEHNVTQVHANDSRLSKETMGRSCP